MLPLHGTDYTSTMVVHLEYLLQTSIWLAWRQLEGEFTSFHLIGALSRVTLQDGALSRCCG
jgi:hypothetical protein